MAQPRRFDHAEALRLHEGGMSIPEISKRLGVAANSVRAAIKKLRNGEGGVAASPAPVRSGPPGRRTGPRAVQGPCSHTTCDEPATRLLTNGVFKKHLALNKSGLTSLQNAGAPVFEGCYSVATGLYPCSNPGCDGASRQEYQPCVPCRVRRAHGEPRPADVIREALKTPLDSRLVADDPDVDDASAEGADDPRDVALNDEPEPSSATSTNFTAPALTLVHSSMPSTDEPEPVTRPREISVTGEIDDEKPTRGVWRVEATLPDLRVVVEQIPSWYGVERVLAELLRRP